MGEQQTAAHSIFLRCVARFRNGLHLYYHFPPLLPLGPTPLFRLPSIRNWSDFRAQFVETSHGNNSFLLLLFRHRTRRKLCNMSEEIWGSATEGEGKEKGTIGKKKLAHSPFHSKNIIQISKNSQSFICPQSCYRFLQ